MNKKKLLIVSFLLLLPVLSFATSGGTPDPTFDDLNSQLKGLLGGSLGMAFVLMGFLGAAAAVAGFASMKVMFPVFGLTLALHYGPDILTKLFTATGDYNMANIIHSSSFTLIDLFVLLASAALLVIGTDKKYRCKNIKKAFNE